VLIPELADHEFCTHQGSVSESNLLGCDSVQNDNEFKVNPGTAGLVIKLSLNSNDEVVETYMEGYLVELIDSEGVVVGSDVSDIDGWYQIIYKHKGKPANYTFRATSGTTVFERVVQLKGNEFEEVNVYLDSTDGAATEYYVSVGDMTGSAKVAGKTWNATVEIQVVNDAQPVANAQVSGAWDTGDLGFCTTDASGWCSVELTKIDQAVVSVEFTVIDITADELIFSGGGVVTVP
jgi:hypothetical protein